MFKFLCNVAPSGTAFAFCGLNPKSANPYTKAGNPTYALHVFDTDVLEFCKVLEECIKQRCTNKLNAKEGELSYSDTYEVQVGECWIKREAMMLSIMAGYREYLHVQDVLHLKNLVKELKNAYAKVQQED